MKPAHAIVFYGVLPLLFGLLLGLQRAGVGASLSTAASLAFWTLAAFFAWVTNDLGTRVTAYLLRPVGFPLWSTLLVGVGVGHLINLPTLEWRFRLFLDDAAARSLSSAAGGWDAQTAVFVIKSLTVSVALWLTANYVLLRGFGEPRYGYGGPAGGGDSTSPTNELDDPPAAPALPAPDEVLAVQAQQHYVVVHRAEGRQLLHMRFGDAERALGRARGCRVHRSFWVAWKAIERIEKDGAAVRAVLTNGMTVPVGRTYLLDLQRNRPA